MKNSNHNIRENIVPLKPIKFLDYIEKVRIPKNEDGLKTHTIIPSIHTKGGSFNVPDKDLSTLYEAIYQHRFVNKEEYHMTESHIGMKHSPYIDDIDMRENIGNNTLCNRKFTLDDLIQYAQTSVNILASMCDLSEDQRYVFVFTKSKPKIDNRTKLMKDGFHIMMPYLVADHKLFYHARYQRVMNDNIKELFTRLGCCNDINDIIDKAVIQTNNWMLYGASKPDNEPYKLEHIIHVGKEQTTYIKPKANGAVEKLGISNARELLDILSIRNKKNASADVVIDLDEAYNSMPDNFKSPNDYSKTKSGKVMTITSHDDRNAVKNKTTHDIKIIKQYIDCLSAKRASLYEDWIRVGWCLHNIDYTLLPAWIEFSKKCGGKFIDGECDALWVKMRSSGLGLPTLRMWARQDDKVKYEEIKKKDAITLIEKCDHKGATCIADYVYFKYCDEFVCADIEKSEWYKFENHKWEYDQAGHSLRNYISSQVAADFFSYGHTCFIKKMAAMSNPQAQENGGVKFLEIQSKAFTEIGHQFANTNVLNSILTECKTKFFDKNFKNKLNEKDDLIHFNNGVLDLTTGILREGYPEDYISISTNINFITDPTPDDFDIIQEIQEFLEKVLPIAAVREYAMTLMASFISGHNKDQKFYMWTGTGSNGKSMTIELLEKALGDYAGKISVAIFTKGRPDANGPTPALAKLFGKRFVSLQEPESDDRLNTGMLKEWTGGDKIQARELNKAPFEFVPKFKFILACNDLPAIDANDGGTWRRIRLIEFVSKFVDKPNPKDKYQYKIDYALKEKKEHWTEQFMWLLAQYYKLYRTKGLHEPAEVTAVTDEYKRSSDIFAQFYNSHIVKDVSSRLDVRDVYTQFKTYFKTMTDAKAKIAIQQVFEKQMTQILGTKATHHSFWKGFKFVTKEEKEALLEAEEDEKNEDDDDNNNGDIIITKVNKKKIIIPSESDEENSNNDEEDDDNDNNNEEEDDEDDNDEDEE